MNLQLGGYAKLAEFDLRTLARDYKRGAFLVLSAGARNCNYAQLLVSSVADVRVSSSLDWPHKS